MSVLPEPATTHTDQLNTGNRDHRAAIHLEPLFTPATDSQLLIIETGLRLLAVWAVKAAEPAEQTAPST